MAIAVRSQASAVRSCCSIGSNTSAGRTSSGRMVQFRAATTAAASATMATPIAISSGSRDGGRGAFSRIARSLSCPTSIRGGGREEADHEEADPERLLAANVVEDGQRQQPSCREGECGAHPRQERALVGQGEPIVRVVTDLRRIAGEPPFEPGPDWRLRGAAVGRSHEASVKNTRAGTGSRAFARPSTSTRARTSTCSSAAEHAAIDGEGVTGGERRCVGQQPHCGGSDLGGSSEAPEWAQPPCDVSSRPAAYSSIALCNMGVSMAPGQIALTRIPRRA